MGRGAGTPATLPHRAAQISAQQTARTPAHRIGMPLAARAHSRPRAPAHCVALAFHSSPIFPAHRPSLATARSQEWRKFNKEGGAASNWRPEGRSAYSVQELASARASRTVNEISSSLPSPSELVRDGRFWLALLVIAAVLPGLFAALSAAPRPGDVMV